MDAVSGQFKKGIRSPGVRFEEMTPQKRSELQTGVPVFVGFGQVFGQGECESYTAGDAKIFRLTCWEQFEQCIRVDLSNGFLDYAIRGFFDNGGENCLVVPISEIDGDWARMFALRKLFRKHGPLEDIDDVDLVCAPDIMRTEILSIPEIVVDLQQHVLDYCRRMEDRFAVLDSIPVYGLDRKNIVERALERLGDIPRKGRPIEGAIYFPWIHVQPLARHKHKDNVRVPPCGHIAGIYARSDIMFGVHKAPANEVVEGAVDLEFSVSDEEQAELNKSGVNCLRSFPGRGIRVWGARTLSSQPDWKYINIRRLFLTLVRWCKHNLNDIVFEPNEPSLWNRVMKRVEGYCYGLYKRGALKGRRPAEAFFVKCDAETNPLDVRSTSQLICEVGLAPVIPAEFIVVHIVKNASGTTTTIPTSI